MEETDFSPEEEKRCKTALQAGERVLLVAKPRVEMDVVGDKLVGQALPAGEKTGQGLKISVKTGSVSLPAIKYTDAASAPAVAEKP